MVLKKNFMLVAAVACASVFAAGAHAATIIDGGTTGLYNEGIGNVLNGSSAAFPGPGDPSLTFGPGDAPDLSLADAALGDWLTDPSNPGGSWSASEVGIPAGWTVESETAIIYAFDGGANGLGDLELSIGVDNGIFVWLNGTFIGGEMRPGGASAGEHVFDLGSVGAGTNYLQLLREDHGGGTGYSVSLTGEALAAVPLPAGLPLLLVGLGALTLVRKRRG